MLDATALDGAAMARVRRLFTELRVEVMAGQYLDLRLDGDRHADAETARRVALLKSGRYTVTRPLQLGLAVAGGHPATQHALEVYGDAIGLAFQLRDDVLGLFGQPAATGKSATDDLRAGKRTLLMLRALALATPAQRTVLERSLGNRDVDEADADRCREIIGGSGALASIETLVRHQHAVAIDAIADVPAPSRAALHATGGDRRASRLLTWSAPSSCSTGISASTTTRRCTAPSRRPTTSCPCSCSIRRSSTALSIA